MIEYISISNWLKQSKFNDWKLYSHIRHSNRKVRNSVTADPCPPSRSMGDAFRSVVDFCIIYQGCLVKRAVRVNRRGCCALGSCAMGRQFQTPFAKMISIHVRDGLSTSLFYFALKYCWTKYVQFTFRYCVIG